MTLRALIRRAIPRESIRHDLRRTRESVARLVRGIGAEMFASRPPRDLPPTGLRVNVGCGELPAPGWINLDANAPAGGFYSNVLNGMPFEDGSVARLHCEHFLEHLEYDHARGFLAECARILEPGGWLRLVVPDAGRYCEAYARGDRGFFERLRGLGGASTPLATPMLVINQMFRMGGEHRFAWDYETLREALSAAGFTEVSRSHRGDARAGPVIDGSDWWRDLESLYVDARR